MAKQPKLPPGMIKRGKKYYANFRQDGKLIREKLSPNFQVAKVMLRDMRMKKYREANGDIDNNATIAELAEAWFRSISQQNKKSTVVRYRQNIANVLRLLPVKKVEHLSFDVIEKFREARLKEFPPNKTTTVKPVTVNKDVGALSRMLDWAVDRKEIGSNPIVGMKKLPEQKKEGRALKTCEAELIFHNSTLHYRRIWYAYFTTGLRKMELANLLFTDIDWEAREIIMRATLTKNSKERRIPIDDILFEILLLQKREAPKRTPGNRGGRKATKRIQETFSKQHVFVSTCNTPLKNNIYRSFIAVCKRCGIETKTRDTEGNLVEAVVLHSLRYSLATDLIQNGCDPRTVQELLGHKTLDMTMRIYAKVHGANKHTAIKRLSFGSALPDEQKSLEENKN